MQHDGGALRLVALDAPLPRAQRRRQQHRRRQPCRPTSRCLCRWRQPSRRGRVRRRHGRRGVGGRGRPVVRGGRRRWRRRRRRVPLLLRSLGGGRRWGGCWRCRGGGAAVVGDLLAGLRARRRGQAACVTCWEGGVREVRSERATKSAVSARAGGDKALISFPLPSPPLQARREAQGIGRIACGGVGEVRSACACEECTQGRFVCSCSRPPPRPPSRPRAS